MRGRRTLLVLVAVALVGCNSAGSDATTTSTPRGVTTTTSSQGTAAVSSQPSTTSTSAGGGEDCLIGSWVLDNEAFIVEMSELFAASGMGEARIGPLEGTVTVDFADDGTMRATRDGWGWEVLVQGSTFHVEVNGTETGTWSVEDSTLMLTTDPSDLIAESQFLVDGEELPMPPGMEDAFPVPQAFTSESGFTCDGDTLTISSDEITSVLKRA